MDYGQCVRVRERESETKRGIEIKPQLCLYHKSNFRLGLLFSHSLFSCLWCLDVICINGLQVEWRERRKRGTELLPN